MTTKKRIENQISREKKETAFIPFIVAGDPDKEKSIEIALEVIEGGADILEIGIPYSDPAADGPTIQKGYKRALQNNFKVKDTFDIIREIRKETDIPIVVMTYYNLIYQYGVSDFYRKLNEIGANGVITPDMPPEESSKALEAAENNQIKQIYLVSENTPENRINLISQKTDGFLYAVSRLGVTGARNQLPETAIKFIKRLKKQTEHPIAIGFGISRPSHVESAVKAGADGVICGSAIVKHVEENKTSEIKKYIQKMKKATLLEIKQN
ncbi:tryptophan synthase subunit alpha [Methanonatronarchaeum sp. AMET6-2]|uniref:tryptophan synthase subunit alpha n=1 Tax=Methanonatronarchaeum sp. AMET6-2 TaxID=2933293 RepID=UPI00121A5C19|nr:tryptophan synthase subunit alpha [Methanonatronarchaeum sp. AMET6-2]RZN61830.1 MAG: tryptophan synthase subunit alpha [Methanonatronarchaeia archaeon]UOY09702.1 tryptophan synthase subunit alpha [Methanonatronarchaeum sp. AMET6-2]